MNTRTKAGRTRQAKANNAITLREGHAAINVKYHAPLNSSIAPLEQDANAAYDATVEDFWFQANNLAQERGYSGVFAEGRSGGWCVPYRQYSHGKLQLEYQGQGPDLGYPQYPDVEHNAAERKRFRAFQRDIRHLLAEVPEMYAFHLSQVVDQNY